jgi:hypothetical protein
MSYFKKIVNNLKYWLLALLLVPFLTWFANAADDLLRQIVEKADQHKTLIHVWENVDRVWRNVFEWSVGIGTANKPSMVVKLTRFLLTLVVALSVTMILYNGLTYIVQTWQWKEWKSLVKNVVYIVIWIIISLFSIVIITILQSVSTTLDETRVDWTKSADDQIVINEGKKWVRLPDFFK